MEKRQGNLVRARDLWMKVGYTTWECWQWRNQIGEFCTVARLLSPSQLQRSPHLHLQKKQDHATEVIGFSQGIRRTQKNPNPYLFQSVAQLASDMGLTEEARKWFQRGTRSFEVCQYRSNAALLLQGSLDGMQPSACP